MQTNSKLELSFHCQPFHSLLHSFKLRAQQMAQPRYCRAYQQNQKNLQEPLW